MSLISTSGSAVLRYVSFLLSNFDGERDRQRLFRCSLIELRRHDLTFKTLYISRSTYHRRLPARH
jgi:hypothetical protein